MKTLETSLLHKAGLIPAIGLINQRGLERDLSKSRAKEAMAEGHHRQGVLMLFSSLSQDPILPVFTCSGSPAGPTCSRISKQSLFLCAHELSFLFHKRQALGPEI